MDIIILDHSEGTVYSNMHEAPGMARRLLDALEKLGVADHSRVLDHTNVKFTIEGYRLTPFTDIIVRADGAEWLSHKLEEDIYVLEIF